MLVKPLVRPICRPLTSAITAALGGFNPRTLFSAGEQGAWYDLSDSTTLFADSAGTTPAVVNGPVGLVLDKSQGQIVSRKNLSSYTEQFNNAIHTKINSTISTNTAVAPDGTTTADTLLDNATAGGHSKQAASALSSVGTNYVYSIYAKAATASRVMVYGLNAVGARGVGVDLTNGSTFTVSGITLETSAVVTDVGSGWYRISIPVTPLSTATQALGGVYTVSGTSFSYSGTGTGVYIWGEQLEVGTSATAYQRVVTGFGDWTPGNHAYQTTAPARPTLRGTPIGGNLVTNGDFASGTAGWSGLNSATVSNASGVLRITYNAVANPGASFSGVTPVIGKVYRLTYTIVASTGGTIQPYFGGAGGATKATTGTFVEYLTATTTATFQIINFGNVGTFDIDNIEIVDVSAGSVTAPYGLDGDGTDDALLCASAGGGTTGFLFQAAIRPDVISKRQTIWSDAGANTGYKVEINASNQLVFSAGNGTAYTSVTTANTVAAGTTYSVECYDDGTNLVAILNQGTPATAARPTVSAGTASFTMQKDNGAASGFMDGTLYSGIYLRNTAKNSATRAQSMRWIRQKAGL